MAALIVVGVFRLSAEGKACADNNSMIANGVTFADAGNTLLALFISQAVMLCVYGCCTNCQVGTAAAISGIVKEIEK